MAAFAVLAAGSGAEAMDLSRSTDLDLVALAETEAMLDGGRRLCNAIAYTGPDGGIEVSVRRVVGQVEAIDPPNGRGACLRVSLPASHADS